MSDGPCGGDPPGAARAYRPSLVPGKPVGLPARGQAEEVTGDKVAVLLAGHPPMLRAGWGRRWRLGRVDGADVLPSPSEQKDSLRSSRINKYYTYHG